MDAGVLHEDQVVLELPHIQVSVLLYTIMALALALMGCGGGEGVEGAQEEEVAVATGRLRRARTTPPGSPSLATITGSVIDTSGKPVNNAGVTIIVPGGTKTTTTTDCNGKFVVTNVPLTAKSFMVSSPNVVAYYNYANYNGHLYDLVDCSLPLPALVAGANAPFTQIQMYLGGANPPPPPPASGCPV